MKVKLNNAPRGCGKLLKRVADGAASFLGQPDCLSVTAAFVGADEIKSLNAAYRNVDKVTDVLSFPSIENDGHGVIVPSEHPFETDPKTGLLDIGDIFICHDVAKAQAKEYGHGIERETAFLFLHGLLHLLGYDHMTAIQEEEMTAAQESILSALDIQR